MLAIFAQASMGLTSQISDTFVNTVLDYCTKIHMNLLTETNWDQYN